MSDSPPPPSSSKSGLRAAIFVLAWFLAGFAAWVVFFSSDDEANEATQQVCETDYPDLLRALDTARPDELVVLAEDLARTAEGASDSVSNAATAIEDAAIDGEPAALREAFDSMDADCEAAEP